SCIRRHILIQVDAASHPDRRAAPPSRIASIAAQLMLSPVADLPGADEFERGAHLPIRAAPRELGGQGPQVDVVLVAEGVAPDAVLLVMVKSAEADAEDIVRPLALAGICGGQQMDKFDTLVMAIGDAAAMRSDPTAVPRPNFPRIF